jgi:hypothetical protein
MPKNFFIKQAEMGINLKRLSTKKIYLRLKKHIF